jgi:hypothetical protein
MVDAAVMFRLRQGNLYYHQPNDREEKLFEYFRYLESV